MLLLLIRAVMPAKAGIQDPMILLPGFPVLLVLTGSPVFAGDDSAA
jgi:hypothetical protein